MGDSTLQTFFFSLLFAALINDVLHGYCGRWPRLGFGLPYLLAHDEQEERPPVHRERCRGAGIQVLAFVQSFLRGAREAQGRIKPTAASVRSTSQGCGRDCPSCARFVDTYRRIYRKSGSEEEH